MIYMSRLGDYYAKEALFRKYWKRLDCKVRVEMKHNNSFSVYRDDFIHEANCALIIAMDCFSEGRDCTFDTYLDVVVSSRFLDLVRKFNRCTKVHSHNCITYDLKENKDYFVRSPLFVADPINEPSYYYRYKQCEKDLKDYIKTLNHKEMLIFNHWLDGTAYQEACSDLGMSVGAYSSRLYRLKQKVKKAIQYS